MMGFRFKNSKFWYGYITIAINYVTYLLKLKRVEQIADPSAKMRAAYNVATFATFANVGLYCAPRLEKIFLDIADEIHVSCSSHYRPNSVLHVFSYGYKWGGHTRVCERWINQSPENEVHSFVILHYGDLAERLVDCIKSRQGEIYDLTKEKDYIDKAKKLREIASQYEKVVLYTSENEGLVIVALGSSDFHRPVIYFNQADHLLWIGTCIADIVADIRESDFTHKRRKVDYYRYLGIPVDTSISEVIKHWDKSNIRRELGMQVDSYIAISTGSPFKYTEIGHCSFRRFAERLTKRDVEVYVIGIKGKQWEDSEQRSNGRIHVLDYVTEREKFYKYLYASDIYIDSFPMGGGTARQDAIQCGLPVLGLTVSRQKDFLLGKTPYEKMGVYYTEKELTDAILYLVTHEQDRRKFKDAQYAELMNENAIEIWNKRLNEVYKNTPSTHIHRSVTNMAVFPVFDDLAVCLHCIYKYMGCHTNLFTKLNRRIKRLVVRY